MEIKLDTPTEGQDLTAAYFPLYGPSPAERVFLAARDAFDRAVWKALLLPSRYTANPGSR